jgi:protocatechuate 3,4-dioxygenase beta subunit
VHTEDEHMTLHTSSHHLHDDGDHDDFGGLHRDLLATGAVMPRRRMLQMAANAGVGLGLFRLLGCSSTTEPIEETTNPVVGACPGRIPEETAGPYPGDGSNGPNVLTLTGVVRNDITTSFAGLSGTAGGVPLTIALTLVNASTCAALANHAVYLWHCDRGGLYSLYSAGATTQNYLRGVQQTDASGKLTFTSIFPGCYAGRWPHIHFEVYTSLARATTSANKTATSQLALPKTACDAVYATTGYAASISNLAGVSLATDGIFRDSSALQLATMTGDVSTGYTATLTVAITV